METATATRWRPHKNRALFVFWMSVRLAGVRLAKCTNNREVDQLVLDMEAELIKHGASTGNRGSSVHNMRTEVRRALEWVMSDG